MATLSSWENVSVCTGTPRDPVARLRLRRNLASVESTFCVGLPRVFLKGFGECVGPVLASYDWFVGATLGYDWFVGIV